MLSSAEEQLILERAVASGYLRPEDMTGQAVTPSSTPIITSPVFSRRIDELLRTGRLRFEQVQLWKAEVRLVSTAGTIVEAPAARAGARPPGTDVGATLDGLSDEVEAVGAVASQSFALNQTLDSASQRRPSPTPLSPDHFPVENWDRYEFLKLLGQGGMGAVYKARDRRLGRIVALKFIRGSDQQMTLRFMQEARAQSRINHPGICKVYDVGEVNGKAYIVMQFIDGLSLHQAAKQLTLLEKVQVIRDAAEALHSAHELSIIHRDIKPANIMLERIVDAEGVMRSHPVIMDFGLAREVNEGHGLTESGTLVGTPAYMSPEQARGEVRKLDRRSDVYGLGATLYDLLSGKAPFEDESVVNIVLKVLNDDVKPLRQTMPDLPEALDVIIGNCLNKEPAQRYQSAQALADDLSRFLNNEQIEAKTLSLLYRLRYRARRNKLVTALLAALFLGLCGFAAYGTRTYLRNLEKDREAKRLADLAQQLGQNIKEMELFMRAAYSLPLHDIAREQAVVRRRMQQMAEKQRDTKGNLAGSFSYALGRGYLVLREYPEAQAALAQAWQIGYRTPEARLALGLVLGERYRQELEQAQRAGDKNWIEAQEKVIEAQYLKPALSYLEGASSDTEAPSYLQGLLAFYRKQYPDALNAAQRAQSEAPWLAEPIRLEGDVYQVMGIKLLDRGEYKEARAQLVRAAERHEAAAAIGRSDGSIYAAEAIDWIRVLEADAITNAPLESALREAIETGEHVIAATPRSASGYQLKSWAYWRSGSTKLYSGQDAESDIQQSIKAAQMALVLDKEDWQTYYYYALCFNALAELAKRRGEDALEMENKAITAYQESLSRNKRFAWSWNDLGNMYDGMIARQVEHGELDRSFFQKTDQCFEQAIQIDPFYAFAYSNRSLLYTRVAQYEMEHGGRADSSVELSLMFGKKGADINPNLPLSYLNMSNILLMRVEHMLSSGDDSNNAAESLKRASDFLDQAEKLDKDLIQLFENRARLKLLEAYRKYLSGQTPDLEILDGLKIVLTGEKAEPRNLELALNKVRLHILAGRWLATAVGALVPLAEARNAAAHAVSLNPKLAAAHEAQCEAFRYSAFALLGQPKLPQREAAIAAAWIDRGLESCTTALALNPTDAAAFGDRGALFLLRAQHTSDAAARKLAGQASLQALTRALEINKWLHHEYDPLLSAAKYLAKDN